MGAIATIILAIGTTSQAHGSSLTKGRGAASARQLLVASVQAFSSSSSVGITGYVQDGRLHEELDISVLSNGDGSISVAIKRAKAKIVVVGGAAYFLANASYLRSYARYSSSQASALANTWLQEATLDASHVASTLSFQAILSSIAHLSGSLTRTPNRKLLGHHVVGVHSSSGFLYVTNGPTRYPVEFQALKKGVHEVLVFSGWNAQPDPEAPATEIKVGVNESENWSGFVLPTSSGSVSQVDGSWIEPDAACASTPNSWSSTWVGIDGESNNQVFQVGTGMDCVKGVQIHYAWFENYPALPQVLSLTISPGDAITAEVREAAPGVWSYSLTDSTTGRVATSPSQIAYSGPATSAEWIEEDPGDHPLALTNFGTVTFSAILVNGAPPSLDLVDNGINMIQKGVPEDQTSPFANDGFTVTFG